MLETTQSENSQIRCDEEEKRNRTFNILQLFAELYLLCLARGMLRTLDPSRPTAYDATA